MSDRPPIHSVHDGPLPYLVAAPRSAPPAGGLRPVLCFLHGYDEGAPLEIRDALTRHGPLHPHSAAWEAGDFVVVAPQLPTRGDLWHRYADAVEHIVRDVREAHGGDPLRTYLSGFSFGGNGVLDLALLQPDRWAALWPVDPTRAPARDPGRPVWLSVGEVARYRRDHFVRALGLEPAGAAPPPDRVYLDGGDDHVGSAARAYRDPGIYAWLLERSLPAER